MGDLSEHFDSSEVTTGDPYPPEAQDVLKQMMTEIMEPARAHAKCPIYILSDNRSERENVAAGGQSTSEHKWTKDFCALDFVPRNGRTRALFDWMRLNPRLPFHQLILEHGMTGSSIIHVSLNRLLPGVRSVLEGATHNAEPYVAADHVAFDPQGAVNA